MTAEPVCTRWLAPTKVCRLYALVAMRAMFEHTCWYMQCAWPYITVGPACSQATKPRGLELWLNCCIIVVFTVGGVLAGIGSVRNIIVHAKDYHVL